MLEINKIYNMDCIEGVKQLDDNSIDTIITDPPYGLSFMGKKWDYDVPKIEIWKACLHVLKPGGTALIFAGSRTQHRMAVNIEDAGFILKDCIMWLYGSGFPKATDISKQLDKDVERKQGKVRTDGGGKSPQKLNNHGKGDTGIGHADGSKQTYRETLPSTPEAKLWEGWKSHGLKPAYEPILVAMKPNDGTYANNALKWGVSGLNIDGGRIQHNEPVKTTHRQQRKAGWNPDNCGFDSTKNTTASASLKGRYPANIILDEESAKMLDEQSGVSVSRSGNPRGTKKKGLFANSEFNKVGQEHNDKGGASRFFYCAKASKAERNAGCEGLEDKHFQMRPFAEEGCDRSVLKNRMDSKSGKNHHPTVKPLKLMEYLCTLTKTPTGGLVLDPFIGSGTTALACRKIGRHFIGFEIDEEYFTIAKKRIEECG